MAIAILRLLSFVFFFCFGYFGFFTGLVFLNAEDKVQNVEQPHAAEDGAGDIEVLAYHHKETESHQKRDGDHNLDLGVPSHTLPLDKGFQVVFIELGSDEPPM